MNAIEAALVNLVEVCEAELGETPKVIRVMPHGDFEVNAQVEVSYEEVPLAYFTPRG